MDNSATKTTFTMLNWIPLELLEDRSTGDRDLHCGNGNLYEFQTS